jgi:hypothetical protein
MYSCRFIMYKAYLLFTLSESPEIMSAITLFPLGVSRFLDLFLS